ncbi:hypothetical protein ACI3E1_07095 [Ligilactobacillus sp. LYQ139]|uniref:hypothetical protein n=1 Tax=Ligilactobacillus sp. LYQ139 TaxID=3378800 RepID=UPI003854F214
MNEELTQKLFEQIKDMQFAVIATRLKNGRGSQRDKLLTLPFLDLGQMDCVLFAVDCEYLGIENHPKLVQALKNGTNLGAAFWSTLSDATYGYDFTGDDPDYETFLDDVEAVLNL